MLHEILFIFYPAILAIAFMKAVVFYLKQLCNGTTPPDQDAFSLHTIALRASFMQFALQKINQVITSQSLILYNIELFEK
jgi:hypothetical protein